MKISQEDLTELQKKIQVYNETPNIMIGGVNAQYEAKKNIDRFSKEMAAKYGYDYEKHAINWKTGEVIDL